MLLIWVNIFFQSGGESFCPDENSGNIVGFSFQNTIYDDASCVSETARNQNKEDPLHLFKKGSFGSSFEMEDTMHDDGKAADGKIMTAVHFPNPLFQDMSEEKN